MKQNQKWIHLKNLETDHPKFGIEGLTEYEAILWLEETIKTIKQRTHIDFEEYHERSDG